MIIGGGGSRRGRREAVAFRAVAVGGRSGEQAESNENRYEKSRIFLGRSLLVTLVISLRPMTSFRMGS